MKVPRQERKKSESGIYHVMMRGINQQLLFEDDDDCKKMMQILADVKAVSKCKLLAFCLMGNHLHVLLQEEHEKLELIMKRIGARYVYWYNLKYKRCGHLFQDRYKSEAIVDDKHLLGVTRYIHHNPLQAGRCKTLAGYRWSSYREYVRKQNIVDTELIFGMVNKKEFEELHKKENTEIFLDYKEKVFRMSDEEAKKAIKKLSDCSNVAEFQKIDSATQRHYAKKFKEIGLSIRQISRLTGVSKGIVERS